MKCLLKYSWDGDQVTPPGSDFSELMSFILSSRHNLSSLDTKDQVVVSSRLINRLDHKKGWMMNVWNFSERIPRQEWPAKKLAFQPLAVSGFVLG